MIETRSPEVPEVEEEEWRSHWRCGAKEAAAGNQNEALKAFQEAQRCLEESEMAQSFPYAKTLMSIGVVHSEKGDFEAALACYTSAQELFSKLQRLESKNGARLHANIAMAKSKQATAAADPDWEGVVSAFSVAVEAFGQQQLLESKEGVRLLIEAGKARDELGRFEEALEDYKAARNTLERAGGSRQNKCHNTINKEIPKDPKVPKIKSYNYLIK